jgi:hypothetical protein
MTASQRYAQPLGWERYAEAARRAVSPHRSGLPSGRLASRMLLWIAARQLRQLYSGLSDFMARSTSSASRVRC